MNTQKLRLGLPILVFAAGLAFLSFVAGMVAVLGDIFPARIARDAHSGAVALIERQRQLKEGDRFAGGLWEPARTEARGLTRHERGRSFVILSMAMRLAYSPESAPPIPSLTAKTRSVCASAASPIFPSR